LLKSAGIAALSRPDQRCFIHSRSGVCSQGEGSNLAVQQRY
jgi:hypothetical protein